MTAAAILPEAGASGATALSHAPAHVVMHDGSLALNATSRSRYTSRRFFDYASHLACGLRAALVRYLSCYRYRYLIIALHIIRPAANTYA